MEYQLAVLDDRIVAVVSGRCTAVECFDECNAGADSAETVSVQF